MTQTPVPADRAGSRPGAVTAAFWLLITGAVLLMMAGVLSVTTDFETARTAAPNWASDDAVRSYLRLIRGVGVLFCVAALGLGVLAVRARTGDSRSRRAVMALGLAIVVIVAAAAVLTGAVFVFALMSLLPIVVGVMLLNRPVVVDWYAGQPFMSGESRYDG